MTLPPSAAQGRRHVLVVDDDPSARLLLERVLSRSHEVHAVSCAEEAIASAALSAPDVVVVDQNLPGMSGLELLRRLRELWASLPAVLITGAPDLSLVGAPVQAFLGKPFENVRAVERAVEMALSASGGGAETP